MTNLIIQKWQIESLPIRHLSVSAIRNFLTNEQDFFKKYIRLEFDNSTAPSLMIWKAVHVALEYYWREYQESGVLTTYEEIEKIALSNLAILKAEGEKMGLLKLAEKKHTIIPKKIDTTRAFAHLPAEQLEVLTEIEKEEIKAEFEIYEICDRLEKEATPEELQEAKNKFIKWGKTGSYNDCIKSVKTAVKNYFDNMPNYTPLYTEKKETVEFSDMEGNEMPLPLKGVIDLIAEDENGELVIVDHKIVASYSDPELDNAAFEIQAGAYFFITQAITGKIPSKMIFDEILKSDAKVVWKEDPTRKLLQKDLKELADASGIEYKKNVKNAELIEMLLKAEVLEYTKTRQPYVIDYKVSPTVIDAFLNIYKAVLNRLAIISLYEVWYNFLPNPFDRMTGQESREDYKQTMEIGKNWQDASKETKKVDELIPDELDF